MNTNMNALKEKFSQEYEKLKAEIRKPNVLIIGGTGVGKSSLVNICFGEDIAKTGTGKPVTDNMTAYHIPDIPIILFDTRGYEAGSGKQKIFMDEVVNYAINNKQNQDSQIHIIWYCIQASGHRILDLDVEIISKFQNIGIPIAVGFTKCDLVTEDEISSMEKTVLDALPNVPFFQLTIKKDLKYLDLEKLCAWSIENLPKGLKYAFIAAQKVNLEIKKKKAVDIILQHTSSSAIVGFVPIPFSDAPILIANQSAMLVRIMFIYDMHSLIPTIQGLIGGLGIPTIISETGIWLVGQLLKLIPGVGTVIGGLISGTVAAALTAAIGYAVIEFCHNVYLLALEGDKEKTSDYFKNAESIFENLVKKYFKEKSSL